MNALKWMTLSEALTENIWFAYLTSTVYHRGAFRSQEPITMKTKRSDFFLKF